MNLLRDRRHVGQVVHAMIAGDGQNADLSVLGQVDEIRKQIRAERDVAAKEVGHHRRAAAVGHTVNLIPAFCCNSSSAMCPIEPMPAWPIEAFRIGLG